MRSLPLVVLLSVFAGISATAPAQSQLPPVTEPPPPVGFEPPRAVGAGEFEASFESAFATDHPANQRVALKLFMPSAPQPAPVVLILHYWGAIDLRVERAIAAQLASRGVAAAIMTLPYHLERTPAGYRSGELAIQPDPARLKGVMVQSVQDARRALDLLSGLPDIDSKRIGIAGTSLGAIIATLVYAVDARISRACFMLGGVDLADILWTSTRVVGERETLRRRGYTVSRLREELAPIEPLTYLRQREGGAAFVVGARYDTVIPEPATRKLIAALPEPRVLWLDTGHYGGVFVQRRLLAEVARFFETEFRDERYEPPAGIRAPTVRLGAVLAFERGFDIGVGVDLLRFGGGKKESFASGILTPRGPQIFLGQRVERGLSIGISLAPRRISGGFFWSTIL